jgi:transcriptional regulator with XRE-family HTH domain
MSRQQNPRITEFSQFIRQRRTELGLSLTALEDRTGFHNSRLSRWERGIEMPDRADRLHALAHGLEVPVAELFSLAGIDIPADLPSHRLYLRSKYGAALPPEALGAIADYADQIASHYGVSTGPRPGEDEAA